MPVSKTDDYYQLSMVGIKYLRKLIEEREARHEEYPEIRWLTDPFERDGLAEVKTLLNDQLVKIPIDRPPAF